MKKLIILLMFTLNIYAKDYGSIGETFPIKEPNLKTSMDAKVKDGSVDKAIARFQKRALDLQYISGVDLPAVKKSSVRFITPYIDNEKNEKVNLLETSELGFTYLFINAKRVSEIEFAKNMKAKPFIILVDGDIAKAKKILNCDVFFDQEHAYVDRLKIKATPTFMEQVGSRLKLSEIKLDD